MNTLPEWEHLETATRHVMSWPEWKRELAGVKTPEPTTNQA